MSFKVGQKVVCKHPVAQLVKGRIYTVREVRAIGAEIGIYLAEIVSPQRLTIYGMMELAFYPWRFRPLHDRPQDNEAFVRKLKDACTPIEGKKANAKNYAR